MAKPRYCTMCRQTVEPEKRFSWIACLGTLCVPYVLFYVFLKRPRCPVCKSDRHFPKIKVL